MPFTGWERGRERKKGLLHSRLGEFAPVAYPFRQSLRLCHLPQGDGFRLCRKVCLLGKGVPLGELSSVARLRGFQRENSLSQSLTALPAPSGREPLARPDTLCLSRELSRHAKGPISEGAVAVGDWGSSPGGGDDFEWPPLALWP